jgi:hypothetical protein
MSFIGSQWLVRDSYLLSGQHKSKHLGKIRCWKSHWFNAVQITPIRNFSDDNVAFCQRWISPIITRLLQDSKQKRQAVLTWINQFRTLFHTAQQKCWSDVECYDLGPPWQIFTRPAPASRCTEDTVKYFLTKR